MNPIKDLLSLYKRLTPPNGALRGAVASGIESVLNVKVPQSAITITRDAAYLSVDASLKAAIFMKRDAVLTDIAARVGEGRVRTIH
ncbi:MAG: hypothetical protein AAB460_01325 [Patescibacteria group bacterium]